MNALTQLEHDIEQLDHEHADRLRRDLNAVLVEMGADPSGWRARHRAQLIALYERVMEQPWPGFHRNRNGEPHA